MSLVRHPEDGRVGVLVPRAVYLSVGLGGDGFEEEGVSGHPDDMELVAGPFRGMRGPLLPEVRAFLEAQEFATDRPLEGFYWPAENAFAFFYLPAPKDVTS